MSNVSYVDKDFPPNENSLMGRNKNGLYLDPMESRNKIIKDSEVEWKRIVDIVAQPAIFEDTINMECVKFGRVSLPYFYCVLSAIAKYYPSLLTKVIVSKDYNPQGMYQVQLYVDGAFQTITIDDYFPCIRGTNVYYFTRPSNFQIWPVLIEKAWAKVNGGYLNIVNLWPGDLFKALTGFSCDELVHPNVTKEQLFDELSKNKGLAFTLSKDGKEIEDKGLYTFQTYIVETTEKVEVDNKCEYLIKIRDAEDESNWSGNYSPKSPLWTEALKSKIDKNKLELSDGEFWMSLDDFYQLFLRTDVCHMLTDALSTEFRYEAAQLALPKVFNLCVENEGSVTVSVLENNWHFHRELRTISHPTSLVIAEYDPANKDIKSVVSKYENNEDLEITTTLKPGLYLVWAYKTTDPNEKIAADHMTVKFSSAAKIKVDTVGDDNNFDLIRNVIYKCLKEKNKDKIKPDDFFYAVDNSFDNSGIGYQMVINPLNNIYQVWKVDSSATHGFLILPPHEKPDVELTIGFNDYEIILGIKRYKYGKHCLNLGVEVTVLKGSTEPPKIEAKPNLDKFYTADPSILKPVTSNPTFSLAEISQNQKFPVLDHWNLFLDKYKNKYPLIVEELRKLQPLTDEQFDLSIIERNRNMYMGEADYGIRFGRGAYVFAREGITYIGYWDKGFQFVRGKVFDKNGKLVFEGEYKNGKRDGKGVYNYEGGEKFEGTFVNGLREGQGVFTWKDGIRWEGPFKNDDMNGEGMIFDGQGSYKATFKDGDLVEN